MPLPRTPPPSSHNNSQSSIVEQNDQAGSSTAVQSKIDKASVPAFIEDLPKCDFTVSDGKSLVGTINQACMNCLSLLDVAKGPLTKEARSYIKSSLENIFASTCLMNNSPAVSSMTAALDETQLALNTDVNDTSAATVIGEINHHHDTNAIINEIKKQSDITNKAIKVLSDKIGKYKTSAPSYSTVVASTTTSSIFTPEIKGKEGKVTLPSRPSQSHKVRRALIVTPKDPKVSMAGIEVKDALRKSQACVRAGCAPVATFIMPRGVKLLFEDTSAIKKVESEINKTDNLKALKQGPRKPQIELRYIDNEVPSSELVKSYLLVNNSLSGVKPSDVRLVYTKKVTAKSYNAVLELTRNVYQRVMQLGRVSINMMSHQVHPHLPFKQCLRCCAFGHTSKHCRAENAVKCGICAGSHEIKDCPEKSSERPTYKCVNCVKYNAKIATYSQNATSATTSAASSNKGSRELYNDAHRAIATNCPLAIKAKQTLNESIDW